MFTHSLKLAGLFLLIAMIAASGCRKKKPAAMGPETLAPEDLDAPIGFVEESGLPEREVTEFGIRVEATLDPVYFQFDSARVDVSESAKADRVAAFLRANPKYKLVVEGHCDERGTAEYNMALGERRAQAVRAYLLSVGVDADRIRTLSFGEEKPAAPGRAESDWSRNRRAEFAIYE
mgnify:CR=1 FL=1